MYVSIYKRGPIFQVPGSKTTDLPLGFQRKKSILNGVHFRCRFWVLLEGSEGDFGGNWEGLMATCWGSFSKSWEGCKNIAWEVIFYGFLVPYFCRLSYAFGYRMQQDQKMDLAQIYRFLQCSWKNPLLSSTLIITVFKEFLLCLLLSTM